MSLRCLKDNLSAVGVPDELESFLHVLIYNSIRFLIHDASSTHGFVKAYFDGYNEVDGDIGVSASDTKSIVVKSGELQYNGNKIMIRLPTGEPHPINGVLEHLLQLFKARYEILEYEAKKAAYDARQCAHPDPLPSLLDTISEDTKPDDGIKEVLAFEKRQNNRYYDPNAAAAFKLKVKLKLEKNSQNSRQPPPRPPTETFELAEALENHTGFIMVLQEYIESTEIDWPLQDRRAVDTLKGYVPPRWACPSKGKRSTASQLTETFFSGETPASASQKPATGSRVASRS